MPNQPTPPEDPVRPWHPASETPPEPGGYGIWLDGRDTTGDWTGTEWWCYKGACSPTHWRHFSTPTEPPRNWMK